MSTSYLVIRPLSEDPLVIEPLIKEISALTGLDKSAIRQRTTGTTLKILKTGRAEDKKKFTAIASQLKRIGLPAAVIGKDEVRAKKNPVRITAVELSSKALRLTSPSGKEVVKLDGTRQCVIVLSTRDHERMHSKRLTRRSMASDEPITTQEMLRFIFNHRPVMDIYVSGLSTPLRIDGSRFNYTSFGELNRGTASLNMPVLLREIGKHSRSVLIDTGLGESNLPFINLSEVSKEDHFLYAFSQYSRFIFLGASRGIFSQKDVKQKNAGFEVLAGLGGMLWGGPVIGTAAIAGGAATQISEAVAPVELLTGTFGGVSAPAATGPGTSPDPFVKKEKKTKLLSPPNTPVVYSYRSMGSWHNKIRIGLRKYKRYIRLLGPSVIFYPLTIIMFGSIGLWRLLYVPGTLFITMLSASLILFSHSFVMIKRKRAIENCPTSKIDTMPMGEVEVYGTAESKYYLRAPYSLTECVYYSYKVYKQIRTSEGSHMKLIESAHSGVVPFYIKDDTGRALILPENAIMHAGDKQSFSANPLAILGAAGNASHDDRWVVERVIATGAPLYILGFAHRTVHSGKEKKKEMNERLREMKTDPIRMRKYDTDMDGEISGEEWEAARSEMEEKILLENMDTGDASDNIAIGDHPSGGLFYISGKHEAGIIGSMQWKIPVFLVAGIAGTTAGIFYTYNLITSSVFQEAVKALLW